MYTHHLNIPMYTHHADTLLCQEHELHHWARQDRGVGVCRADLEPGLWRSKGPSDNDASGKRLWYGVLTWLGLGVFCFAVSLTFWCFKANNKVQKEGGGEFAIAFGRKITKYTIIYSTYIRFWPTLLVTGLVEWATDNNAAGFGVMGLRHTHRHTHTHTHTHTHARTRAHTHTHTHTHWQCCWDCKHGWTQDSCGKMWGSIKNVGKCGKVWESVEKYKCVKVWNSEQMWKKTC